MRALGRMGGREEEGLLAATKSWVGGGGGGGDGVARYSSLREFVFYSPFPPFRT